MLEGSEHPYEVAIRYACNKIGSISQKSQVKYATESQSAMRAIRYEAPNYGNESLVSFRRNPLCVQ